MTRICLLENQTRGLRAVGQHAPPSTGLVILLSLRNPESLSLETLLLDASSRQVNRARYTTLSICLKPRSL